MRILLQFGLFFALPTAIGCGGGKDGLCPVRGKVLVNGQAAERVVVTLHPLGGGTVGRRSMATTEADGSFQISTSGPGDGAPPGEYAVTLVWPEYNAAGDPGPDRLKGRYATPAKAFTKIAVTDKTTKLDPFEVRD
jgi:hypothetical protein